MFHDDGQSIVRVALHAGSSPVRFIWFGFELVRQDGLLAYLRQYSSAHPVTFASWRMLLCQFVESNSSRFSPNQSHKFKFQWFPNSRGG